MQAALLLRDAPALTVLAAPGAFERNCARIATGSVVVGHEAFWPLYGSLFAALARGEPVEAARIEMLWGGGADIGPSSLM